MYMTLVLDYSVLQKRGDFPPTLVMFSLYQTSRLDRDDIRGDLW